MSDLQPKQAEQPLFMGIIVDFDNEINEMTSLILKIEEAMTKIYGNLPEPPIAKMRDVDSVTTALGNKCDHIRYLNSKLFIISQVLSSSV